MKFDSKSFVRKVSNILELVIVIIILLGVILGIPDLFRYVLEIFKNDSANLSYKIFGEFLKHVLMLVVGIELVYMIISHKNENILTLVLFVIARKMLVYAEDMTDILIGTISIVLVFIALRFFVLNELKTGKYDGTFSAATTLTKLKNDYNIIIHAEENTIGGLVYKLTKEARLPLATGVSFVVEDYKITITQMNGDIIERVSIFKK